MRRAFGTLLLLLILTGLRIPARADQIDDYIQAQRQKWHIPGVSVAVVRDGKVVLEKGYGVANVEFSVPATKDTVYGLLSVGKQFTAAAILLLVEEGKVALDAKVATYLPDIPDAWSAVTVRHLLTHTSGIRDYTDVQGFFENIRQDASPEDLLKPVKAQPLNFAPGTGWRYSNSNYFLLGLIIEKVSGKRFADFLQERIFQPLGMATTRVDDKTEIVPNRAGGYHWLDARADQAPAILSGYHGRKNVLQNAVYISPTRLWAAGGVISSTADLVRWDTALREGKLLKKATLEQMWTPAKLASGAETDYGFGNELHKLHGHRIAGHQGGGMAFNATLYRFLDDGLTVIVLCNQTSAPSEPMAAHIAGFYLPDLSDANNKGIEDKDPKTTALLKGVLLDAAQGKADASLFAPEAQATVAFVRRAGPQFLGQLGSLKSFVLLERRDEGSRRVLRYRAVFGDTSLLWTFALKADGKILSLEPTPE